MKRENMFIVVEGGEGAGKSIAVQLLADYLQSKGYDVIRTREPGGCKGAEDIRSVIMNHEWSKLAEMHLFAAARLQHCEELIKPALDAGKIVISDRYTPSNVVYQGIVGGCGIDTVIDANKHAVQPDLVIYFDVDPEVGLARIAANQEREVTRFDKMALDVHHQLREAYKSLEELHIFNDFKVLDANGTIEETQSSLRDIVMHALGGE